MNKYWFRKRRGIKSKDIGWGWVPISWEGWFLVTVLIFLIGIIGFVFGVFSDEISKSSVVLFLGISAILVFLLAVISKKKTKPNI